MTSQVMADALGDLQRAFSTPVPGMEGGGCGGIGTRGGSGGRGGRSRKAGGSGGGEDAVPRGSGELPGALLAQAASLGVSPKRMKRILANRRSAAAAKARKAEYYKVTSPLITRTARNC